MSKWTLGRVAVIGIAGVLLSSCLGSQSSSDKNNSNLTSSWVRPDNPQEKIGAREHPLVLAKYGGEYKNENTERLIAVIVGKLVATSDDPSRIYKITVLNSPKVNAFALPGGYLYVTRGLLALANDASELAAVIAHEMAHVSSDHAILRQEKVSSAAIGEQVVEKVLDSSTAGKVALAANKIRLSSFSKDQELQADAVGIRMVGRAGYDSHSAARFLETMGAYQAYLSGGKADDSDSFFSSHPSTPKRVSLARRHARFFGAPDIGERARDRYLEGIDGLLYGDTPEEGFVRAQTFAHSGLGIAFTVPRGFMIDNQPKAVMISGPGDVATRFDAAVLPPTTRLAKYLKSGWITGLVEETIREEQINGLQSATAVARGEGWRFKVRVIRNGSQLYRFVSAAPQTNTNLDAVSRQISSSFRLLKKSEIASLRPLTIKVLTIRPGQTERWFVSRMKEVSNPQVLFRLINGLKQGDTLTVGQKVKIITDS